MQARASSSGAAGLEAIQKLIEEKQKQIKKLSKKPSINVSARKSGVKEPKNNLSLEELKFQQMDLLDKIKNKINNGDDLAEYDTANTAQQKSVGQSSMENMRLLNNVSPSEEMKSPLDTSKHALIVKNPRKSRKTTDINMLNQLAVTGTIGNESADLENFPNEHEVLSDRSSINGMNMISI